MRRVLLIPTGRGMSVGKIRQKIQKPPAHSKCGRSTDELWLEASVLLA
jgi:hypothetical protein